MSNRKPILPSHMKKAIDRLEELAGVVDLVIEAVDARAPHSTRCDFISRMLGGCDDVIVLTKADIADAAVTKNWLRHFNGAGTPAVVFPYFFQSGRDAFLDKILAARRPECRTTTTRAVVVGLPNVGKSTLINFLIGRKKTKVGAAPGVTLGVQLINLNDNFIIFDTPGIVSPRIARREEGMPLALVGCLQETFFEPEEAAIHLLSTTLTAHTETFREYYDLPSPETDPVKFCESVARRRGFLRKGGVPDINRVHSLLVQDFSTGRISGISLEAPA